MRSFIAGLGRDGTQEDAERGVEDIPVSACLPVSGFSWLTEKANRNSYEDRRQTGAHTRTEGMPSSFARDYPGSLGIKPLPNLRLGGCQLGGVTNPQLLVPSAFWKSSRLWMKALDCPSPVPSPFEVEGRRLHL